MRVMVVDPGFTYSTMAVAEGYYKAFEHLGYEVVEYDTVGRMSRLNKKSYVNNHELYTYDISSPIISSIINDSIDFMLVIHGLHVHPMVVAQARSIGCKTGIILTDEPQLVDHSKKWSRFYDYVFTNDANTVFVHKTENNKVYYLPTAVDNEIFKPNIECDEKYKSDVLIGGSLYEERKNIITDKEFVDTMIKNNVDVKVVGARKYEPKYDDKSLDWYGDKTISINEMAKYVSNAKLCLDIPRDVSKCGVFGTGNSCDIVPSNLSPRLYECGASKTLCLTDNSRSGVYELFGDVGLPVYDKKATPKEIAEFVIDNLSNDNCVEEYYKCVIDNHTYMSRVKEIAKVAKLTPDKKVSKYTYATSKALDMFEQEWVNNITQFKNIEYNSLSVLKTKNRRCVLIGNSPSIKDISYYGWYRLQESYSSQDVYTVNCSLKTVLKNCYPGYCRHVSNIVIHPDDNIYERYKNEIGFENVSGRKLLCSTTASHKLVSEWVNNNGSVYAFATGESGLKGASGAYFGIPYIPTGTTVVYTALEVLKYLGYESILLAGFDFSYTDNMKYIDTPLQYENLSNNGYVLTESIGGGVVLSDNVLMDSLERVVGFMENNPSMEFLYTGRSLLGSKNIPNLLHVE